MGGAALSSAQVGVPGARENRTRVALFESGAKRIALGVEVERLDLALDGEPRIGGWTVGGGVRARLTHRRIDLEFAIDADRLLRSGAIRPVASGRSGSTNRWPCCAARGQTAR